MYFIVLIIAACVAIYEVFVTFAISFDAPVNAIIFE